jgi:hypothetical protein
VNYDLSALRDAADRACDQAYQSREHIDDAINWGDLACVKATKWVDDEGNEGYAVLIEEASPDATELCAYVSAKLFDAGFVDVEVLTEW